MMNETLPNLEKSDPEGIILVEFVYQNQTHRVKGKVKDVVEYIRSIMSGSRNGSTETSLGFPNVTILDVNSDTSLAIRDVVDVSPNVVDAQVVPDLADLIQFHLKVQPKSQREEIMTIAYFFRKMIGQEDVSLDDFRAAYEVLADVPVKAPANLSARIRETIESGWLRGFKEGDYSRVRITIKGINEVEKWLNAD